MATGPRQKCPAAINQQPPTMVKTSPATKVTLHCRNGLSFCRQGVHRQEPKTRLGWFSLQPWPLRAHYRSHPAWDVLFGLCTSNARRVP